MDTELITACVVSTLAVIVGVRRIVRGLSLLTEDSRRFIIVLVSLTVFAVILSNQFYFGRMSASLLVMLQDLGGNSLPQHQQHSGNGAGKLGDFHEISFLAFPDSPGPAWTVGDYI